MKPFYILALLMLLGLGLAWQAGVIQVQGQANLCLLDPASTGKI